MSTSSLKTSTLFANVTTTPHTTRTHTILTSHFISRSLRHNDIMLEGNSKGSALRKLTHRPTSRGQCTCWECSKDIFKANEKLNEVVFDSLRREKLANGERMIDYPSFLEITAGRLTQDHWQAVQMQVFMQLDEMFDKRKQREEAKLQATHQ